MQIFLSAFDDIPDPRADNARHELGELLVVTFVAVLCGATSCAEIAAFGRAKERVFRDFLKLHHAIPSHDTFSAVFRMLDPKALDTAIGRVLAEIAGLLGVTDVPPPPSMGVLDLGIDLDDRWDGVSPWSLHWRFSRCAAGGTTAELPARSAAPGSASESISGAKQKASASTAGNTNLPSRAWPRHSDRWFARSP